MNFGFFISEYKAAEKSPEQVIKCIFITCCSCSTEIGKQHINKNQLQQRCSLSRVVYSVQIAKAMGRYTTWKWLCFNFSTISLIFS